MYNLLIFNYFIFILEYNTNTKFLSHFYTALKSYHLKFLYLVLHILYFLFNYIICIIFIEY